MDFPELVGFYDVPLPVDAVLQGPRMCVRDLLALGVGSIISTETPAGDNVTVLAGHSPVGIGELTTSNQKVVVKILRFGGDAR